MYPLQLSEFGFTLSGTYSTSLCHVGANSDREDATQNRSASTFRYCGTTPASMELVAILACAR
ncbi:hypothetical protein M758_1G100500 [Ceratodon purpureus]|uniref:Uncharacterized protein n=1 Tax=Ceratodon purpureus TaxID=3225 RepID=A0A8T0J6P6_CERPU|nr:hypothetical protein KC19_1G111300 [Ceratodon purpureus]KAG0629395.1 hypothetical protein M758_1G100500 [Ceratodon purpureus]